MRGRPGGGGSVCSEIWSRQTSGNAKLLTYLDQVWIFQNVAVGFKDGHVEARITVVLLGDLRERVALLDLVELRTCPFVLFLGHRFPLPLIFSRKALQPAIITPCRKGSQEEFPAVSFLTNPF